MKCKVALASIILLLISNSWAGSGYYTYEEISVDAQGANYGPYPSALSDDGSFIASYSMKASLSQDLDIGLPFTFNRACQYDNEICELAFYGSESSTQLSYESGYQAWRNAQAEAQYGSYSSYMMGSTYDTTAGTDTQLLPYDDGDYDTDVKITDVTGDSGEKQFVVGYSSDSYNSANEREFVRRAFIYNQSQGVQHSLLPDFVTSGGFSSAYKIKEVTYTDGTSKTLVVGASSISFPQDDSSDNEDEYFKNCYFSDERDSEYTLNELVNCPGFDTQAWAWDVTNAISASADSELSGFSLATQWLDNNQDNDNSNITYSASALDINASGIAVGVSTFEYSSADEGGRQRAIIMTPDAQGVYGAPTELTDAVADVNDDEGDTIYNTWAAAITDTNIVIGNREYEASKSLNKPTEFFVYDIDNDSISFPLKDIKVQTTKQRLGGDRRAKTGTNSRAYDINEAGFIVGKADDYDQTHSVSGGSPRSQSAFLYNNTTGESWFINDLICSEDDNGTVTSPLYKIRSARVINDDGTVLAEGWKYDSDADYLDENKATAVMLKLTRNTGVSAPDNSPNCWQSDLLSSEDKPYKRSGGAVFWLWILALPLLLVRRFFK